MDNTNLGETREALTVCFSLCNIPQIVSTDPYRKCFHLHDGRQDISLYRIIYENLQVWDGNRTCHRISEEPAIIQPSCSSPERSVILFMSLHMLSLIPGMHRSPSRSAQLWDHLCPRPPMQIKLDFSSVLPKLFLCLSLSPHLPQSTTIV